MAKKTITSMMSQAKRKLLAEMNGESEKPKKKRKSAKEQYAELREQLKDPEPQAKSFSDKFEEELKKSLFSNSTNEIIEEEEQKVDLEKYVKRNGL